jgi:hypothetical protein
LAEASKQMQPEVRNWFPTVANVGASPMAHHHHHHSGEEGAAKGSLLGEEAREAGAAAAAANVATEQLEAARGGEAAEGSVGSSSSGGVRKSGRARRPSDGSVGDATGVDTPTDTAKKTSKAVSGRAGGSFGGEGLLGESSEQGLATTHKLTDSLAAAASETLKKATPSTEQQIFIVRWAQKALGGLVGLGTAAFLIFYQWVIEPAPPKSLRTKAFAAACKVGGWGWGGGKSGGLHH